MRIGYVSGSRRGREAREVTKACGRAVYFECGGDKDDVDGQTLLPILKQGVGRWNLWRAENRKARPYFRGEFFRLGANLDGIDLSQCTMMGCEFDGVSLLGANLSGVDGKSSKFTSCNFSGSKLRDSNFFGAGFEQCGFHDANLESSYLVRALLRRCSFSSTRLANAEFGETDFLSCDLSSAKGLVDTKHLTGSTFDFATIAQNLPTTFLRHAGVSEALIRSSQAASGAANSYQSCFISYSSKDEIFAEKLCRDLLRNGVGCWFAPHDLCVGALTHDTIDDQISKLDRLIVILSQSSIKSSWVKDEVLKAFAEERRRGGVVLMPIRLDNDALVSSDAWVQKLRDQRNIGNFTSWDRRNHHRAAYGKLLASLKK